MKKSILIRLLLILLFLLCGRVLHIFFFLAAFIAYSVFSDLRGEPNKRSDSPAQDAWTLQNRKDWTFITAKTVDWKRKLCDAICESPAETDFLIAMISSYQLLPDRETLKGGGLELKLQVPIYRYRVDFLANEYLVVEIDGAAYHSSPEAVEKDRIRDAFLTHKGYAVLRIPAKVVFNSPSEAVERVRCAISNLAHERNIRAEEEVRAKALNPPPTFFGALGQAIADSSQFMDRAFVLQKTEAAFNETFGQERVVIEKAIELAKIRINIELRLSRSDQRTKQIYFESLKQVDEATGSSRSLQSNRPSPQPLKIPALRPPDLGSDPKYSTAIKEMYSGLLEKRLQFFNDIRKTLEQDNELANRVKKALRDWNCDDLWQLIRVSTAGESPHSLSEPINSKVSSYPF